MPVINPLREERVALVHDWLTGMRGGEKCLEVLCELFPDADLYTLVYDPGAIPPSIQRMNVTSSWIDRLPQRGRYFRYLLPLFPRAVESFELKKYDLVLSSSHCVAKGVLPGRAFHISYLHTPMRYIWDLRVAYLAGGASVFARAGLYLTSGYLRRWDLRSAERVNRFIAISQNVAAKVQRLYGRSADVIYPPVEVNRFFLGETLDPYYLIVSALVPYKRIDVAVDAFNQLKLPLKIVGDGPLRNMLRKRAKSTIEFLGWVDDAALAQLYTHCQALVFPGEEDFGITPLEAQASGRPVIAYQKGGLLETVIGLTQASEAQSPTGIFFPEQRAESLIEAIELFRRNRAAFDPRQLRRHAEKFSRQRFKQEIALYVEHCLKQSVRFKRC